MGVCLLVSDRSPLTPSGQLFARPLLVTAVPRGSHTQAPSQSVSSLSTLYSRQLVLKTARTLRFRLLFLPLTL